MIGGHMGYARNSQFDKPFDEWTKKQREWLDVIYDRLFPPLKNLRSKEFPSNKDESGEHFPARLFFSRSPRGLKPNEMWDKLFFERKMTAVRPPYRGFSQRLFNPSSPTDEQGQRERIERANSIKRAFIRACQHREAALMKKRLPLPPEN
jgi:hypothetical protein